MSLSVPEAYRGKSAWCLYNASHRGRIFLQSDRQNCRNWKNLRWFAEFTIGSIFGNTFCVNPKFIVRDRARGTSQPRPPSACVTRWFDLRWRIPPESLCALTCTGPCRTRVQTHDYMALDLTGLAFWLGNQKKGIYSEFWISNTVLQIFDESFVFWFAIQFINCESIN